MLKYNICFFSTGLTQCFEVSACCKWMSTFIYIAEYIVCMTTLSVSINQSMDSWVLDIFWIQRITLLETLFVNMFFISPDTQKWKCCVLR